MEKKCQCCGQVIPEGNWAENWCDPCIDAWTVANADQEVQNIAQPEPGAEQEPREADYFRHAG